MAIILLMMMLSGLEHLSTGMLPTYQDDHFVGPLAWVFNLTLSPVTPWIIWAIYLVIVVYLTKLFNDHLQLRRD